ncbi:hypothetical protein GCM10011492_31010 [Flexivirga endophytica]|uniref:Glycosyltransferase 2-like domain-containing protein n=1 Tax=Flexivirga endophytica TaxID=1849103 RepID=A0A916TD60_9MICO|nr:glycosyltransferase family A protein [Flexivirga endophytica]GGB38096.1 hypothetical protein GCM10011492_31010 [Flexivirga endophytica]GHB46053.1 hypothetical protein GCM10008112_13400 [Flexivirga endophytica]
MVLVSVVVPVYNPGGFLNRAIDSVLAQTMDDLECVVVDDGSSDDLAWVAEHADRRLRYLRQENHGVSIARNVGVLNARGRIIAFLDQDDEWLPAKLDRQLQRLESVRNASFCYTGFDWVRGEHAEHADPQQVTYRGLLTDQHVCLSSVIMKRSAYLSVGGHDPLLRIMQDYDLFLRLCRLGEPVGVEDSLVRYHLHDANVSADYRAAAKERFRLIQAHRDAAERDADQSTVAACDAGLRRTRELYGSQALDAARAAHHQSDLRETVAHLYAACRLTRGAIIASLRPAIGSRLKRFGRQDHFRAER